MSDEPEIIDRERPGVSDHKSRLDQLAEAAREYERVKKAKARNTWEKREDAYGTPQEIQVAIRLMETSVIHSRNQIGDQDVQQALKERLITEDEARRLRDFLTKAMQVQPNRDSSERE